MTQPFRILSLLCLGAALISAAPIRPASSDATGGDQKHQSELEEAQKELDQARARNDAAAWTRQLVKVTDLRMALHGYETAVRQMRETPWPTDLLSRTVLTLFYARALTGYLHAYSWEIRQREQVSGQGTFDLKAASAEQLGAEVQRVYDALWKDRESLGLLSVDALVPYIEPNNYPRHIRGTARDTLTHLRAEALADSSLWTPAQSNALDKFELSQLMARRSRRLMVLARPGGSENAHPAELMAAVLDDLEAWHTSGGRKEAALDARLTRIRQLHALFTDLDERVFLRGTLEADLKGQERLAWWSVGQATLAELFQEGDDPTKAHAVATRGAAGKEPGAQRCKTLKAELERPSFYLQTMNSDGPKRRSIEVTHRNLKTLQMAAYPIDLHTMVLKAEGYSLLLRPDEIRDFIAKTKPAVQWQQQLLGDSPLKEQRTWVTPPMEERGLYLITASGPDGGMAAGFLFVTDLVMVMESDTAGEVSVLDGNTGQPRAGVTVQLYRYDWKKGHERVAEQRTDAQGRVSLPVKLGPSYFALARQGPDSTLLQHLAPPWRAPEEPKGRRAWIYTDRSAYRPGQTVRWKVVAFSAEGNSSYKTLPRAKVSVALHDANGEQVDTRAVTTNAFGSAAGEFLVPEGKVLGSWSLRTTPASQSVQISVEEYKRPTFEVTFNPGTKTPARLNRDVTLEGEAKYLFGQPVSQGQVRWRVTRQPLLPDWWLGVWRGWMPPQEPETVAAGDASLNSQGRFAITFLPKADERLKGREQGVTYRYQVTGEVTDEAGETRSASRSLRLGFSSVEAAIRLEKGFVPAGQQAQVTVVRQNLDGAGQAGGGSYRLVSLKTPARPVMPADELAADGRPSPRWDISWDAAAVLSRWADGFEVARGVLTHDAKGVASLMLPKLAPGAYRLRYETTDTWGEKTLARAEWIVSGPRESLQLPLLLAADKPNAKVGETIQLHASSGFEDQQLWLDTYRAGKRVSRRFLTKADATVLEFPVKEEDRGGVTFVLTTLRDYQWLTATVAVEVKWDNRELRVSFESFRDTLKPGAKETLQIKVKPVSGAPISKESTELLVYMFDEALESIQAHTPPQLDALYPQKTFTRPLTSTLSSRGMDYSEPIPWNVPPSDVLQPDRLKFTPGYGVGGPGRRRGAVPMAAQSLMMLEKSTANDERQEASAKKEAAAPPRIDVRQNFAETALWAPQVTLNAAGEATVDVTLPDSLTAWKVWAHALTREMRGGSVVERARTVKELMVRPYLPRFFREGDTATLRLAVNNASDKAVDGELTVEMLDPVSNQSLASEFRLPTGKLPFRAEAGKGTTVPVGIKVPRGLGEVIVRVKATAGAFSDGEQRVLPVLPAKVQLAESRFVTLQGNQSRTLAFEALEKNDDPTRVNQQLVVTVDAQLFQTVLASVPTLVENRFECTEAFANTFLATGILSEVFRLQPSVAKLANELARRPGAADRWNEKDPNRSITLDETPWLVQGRGGDPKDQGSQILNPVVAKAVRDRALGKLSSAQTSSGGFPWFPGGPPSPHMTLYILYELSKAAEFGVSVPPELVKRAWAFVALHYRDQYASKLAQENCCGEFVTFLNYVASNFRDPALLSTGLTPSERQQLLEYSFKQWRAHSPYLKAMLALTLHRAGRSSDAKLVFDSVMDSAKTTPDEGTFWAPEDRGWLWYNDRIESHAFALRVLLELAPKDARQQGLVQWLMLNKKLNQWSSSRSTAEVLYSLMKSLSAKGEILKSEAVTLRAGTLSKALTFEPERYAGKSSQWVIPGEQISSSLSPIQVQQTSPGLMFASATWHFTTEEPSATPSGDLFEVQRYYFKREAQGTQTVLVPLKEGTQLQVGDQVEVLLSVRAKHEAEYILLRDPRPAGFEPESSTSGYRWTLGVGRYEEVRDSGTNFFFDRLPVGEFPLKYRLRASIQGTFKAAPAQVQSLYAPEFTARSGADQLNIRQ